MYTNTARPGIQLRATFGCTSIGTAEAKDERARTAKDIGRERRMMARYGMKVFYGYSWRK